MKNLWPSQYQKLSMNCPLYVCPGPQSTFILSSSDTLDEFDEASNSVESHELDIEFEEVVEMKYLELQELLIAITRKGKILSYSPESRECSVEGEFTSSITSAQWSPNQEYLAIYCSDSNLILQTADLELLLTKNLGLGKNSQITWRGDSKYFQVCAETQTGFRVSTFTASGELCESHFRSDEEGPVQNVCEKETLLTSEVISWQPSGAYIAGVNNHSIVFWEKNGLRHGEFGVEKEGKVKQLSWSWDSKVLAVVVGNSLCLYTKENFKWYLKALKEYASEVKVTWKGTKLIVAEKDVEVIEFHWRFDQAGDLCLVVDGERICITDFKEGVMPPPMCHKTLNLGFVPDLLAVSTSRKIAVSHKDQIYSVDFSGVVSKLAELSVGVLAFVGETLYFGSGKDLYKLEEGVVLVESYSSEILGICSDTLDTAVVTLSSKKVFREKEFLFTLKEATPYVYPVYLKEQLEVLYLCKHKLYLTNALLCSNATSALVSGNFLFFTRQNAPLDELYLFNTKDGLPFELGDNPSLPSPAQDHFYSRSIEKGSEILCLGMTRLILKHQRGNLEAIYPRLTMISYSLELLDNKKYLEVFLMFRKHKIDLDFIYDYNPELFLSNLDLFIQEVSRVDYINLFLTNISDRDTSALYLKREPSSMEGKKNLICDKVREKLNPETHLLSIITSYAAKSPPDLEEALRWIQELMVKNPRKPPKAPHQAQRDTKLYPLDALKYLSWLVDPNKLYSVALGMYDLELTTQVAQFTQKDPKEYIPYLKSLKEMDPVRMKAKICCDLNKDYKALLELKSGGQEYYQEALSIIQKSELLLEGLELFSGTEFELPVKELVASSLFEKENYLEAGSVFESCRNFEKAIESYVKAEEYEVAANLAPEVNMSAEELLVAQGERLGEVGKFETAARLLEKGNSEAREKAMRYYIQAGKFNKALTLASTSQGKSLLRSTVETFGNEFLSEIQKSIDLWYAKYQRLEVVQKTKKAMPKPETFADDEAASQYSSDTQTSRATQFSRKQKKKQKKMRKAAAKEGSPYEEDYLVDLLLTLRPDQTYRDKADSLAQALILTGNFSLSKAVLQKLKELQETTNKPLRTLRHEEFLDQVFENFTELTRNPQNENQLCDVYSRSTFLSEGLASHQPPTTSQSSLQKFLSLAQSK